MNPAPWPGFESKTASSVIKHKDNPLLKVDLKLNIFQLFHFKQISNVLGEKEGRAFF
jgi:hypothetical protein